MIPGLCALGVLVGAVGFLLSEMGWGGKRLFSVLGIILMVAVSSEGLFTVYGEISQLGGAMGEVSAAALKVVGVGYVFGISSDLCSELGEGGAAKALTFAGRVEIIVLILPYLKEVVSLGLKMIK